MKEYIERVHYIDGGSVIKTVTEYVGELIRCKDCNFFKSKVKTHHGFCACHFMEVIDNDYCSAAERKEE